MIEQDFGSESHAFNHEDWKQDERTGIRKSAVQILFIQLLTNLNSLLIISNCRAGSHMSPVPTLIPGKKIKTGERTGGWYAYILEYAQISLSYSR